MKKLGPSGRVARRVCQSPRPVNPTTSSAAYEPGQSCCRWFEDGHTHCSWAGFVFWPRPVEYEAAPDEVAAFQRGPGYWP